MPTNISLTNGGTLITTGEFDEITESRTFFTTSVVYTAELDEIALKPYTAGLAQRITSTGKLMVATEFDEVSIIPDAATFREELNATPGSFSFSVPLDLTSISAVVVGGGGQGGATINNGSSTGGGGGGGGLSWKNDIPVTPGETLTVVVGAGGKFGMNYIGEDGGASYIARGGTILLLANGGKGGVGNDGNYRPVSQWVGGNGGTGGASVDPTYGGGNGGKGGNGTSGPTDYRAGGGGAGGYSGNGGAGGNAG